ncbi:hypothetical protein [Shewanella goraebulensis]|uniref:hypothetical protein n=1 Tax=Shewanella goraebulensis TaxID=3050637 RepID=UPI0025506977|nr:hypothetical protein [Shewanella goraebulensis]
MRNIIVSAGLKILPSKLQYNALIKALNFLFSSNNQLTLSDISLVLRIDDLDKQWAFRHSNNVFTPLIEISDSISAVSLSADLNIFLTSVSKFDLIRHIEKGDIKLSGNNSNINKVNEAIRGISHQDFERLIEQFYQVFRANRPDSPRLDVNQLSASDIKNDSDLEYIRDEALRLETINLSAAHKLMCIAKQFRPDGPLINQKVEEYSAKLS